MVFFSNDCRPPEIRTDKKKVVKIGIDTNAIASDIFRLDRIIWVILFFWYYLQRTESSLNFRLGDFFSFEIL